MTVEDIESTRDMILQHYQRPQFKEEYRILNRKRNQSRKLASRIGCVKPKLDEKSLIRVGGRLRQGDLEEAVKHPILLPLNGHLTKLIVRWGHEKTVHRGRK